MKTSWQRLKSPRNAKVLFVLATCAVAAAIFLDGAGALRVQPTIMAKMAKGVGYSLAPGPSEAIRFTLSGPYDHRMGYSALPRFIERLAAADYAVDAQARMSAGLMRTMDWGLFAPYREKAQAGLAIYDCRGQPVFSARYPERIYKSFEDVPRLLVDTLLFIENQNLLDEQYPRRNPAIDVGRFFKAVLDQSINSIHNGHEGSGGSTLATQIEKYRHSPSGRTPDAKEKLRQMASASLRAYLAGENTQDVRRQLVVDYLNTVPLAAKEGLGEISGLGDGLWAWFGRDWHEVNRLLRSENEAPLAERALAYKQALALIIAERRPSFYLRQIGTLEARADAYLNLVAASGIVGNELRDEARAQRLVLREQRPSPAGDSFVARKAPNALRVNLAALLGMPNLYDLDRLDLAAHSTLDARLQEQVTAALARLGDSRAAAAEGLMGEHMLQKNEAAELLYSFVLYESTPSANLLRVQADNLNQPWDVNAGAKLDLGSTAKLRTLIAYLGIVAELHDRHARLSPEQIKAQPEPADQLGRWALGYLAHTEDRSLAAMLEAALDRTYSANPGETFFTGGGVHTFENFDPRDNGRTLTVREGLRRSVNLVFVRLMRDIVRYYVAADGPSARILADARDPRRLAYLGMYADEEGRAYLRRFHEKYRGRTADEIRTLLLGEMRASPRRLAAVIRYVEPEADESHLAALLARRVPAARLPAGQVAELHRAYATDRLGLADRGYLTGIHPLELWMARFLIRHPEASFAQASFDSRAERHEIYAWLFKSRFKHAQDIRIATMLEKMAFRRIHREWQRLGYPFDSLVPSYASALGASADRPTALAELMGILINDGVRRPTARIERLHFAADTPFETRLSHRPPPSERVMRPEVARIARGLLADVVKSGTALRLHRVFKNDAGEPILVGGKTGTGDQRLETYGKGGRVISSRAVARTGTFVFYLGDRHFGTLTAYVRGPAAAKFRFTSSLPVQVMKVLAPVLSPIVAQPENGGRCGTPAVARHEPEHAGERESPSATPAAPGS